MNNTSKPLKKSILDEKHFSQPKQDQSSDHPPVNTLRPVTGDLSNNGWPPLTLPINEPLTSFPKDVYPPSVENFIDELAASTETPRELAGMSVLGVLATAAQRGYEVEIEPQYLEPLSMWNIVALPPASRKTQVLRRVCEPLTLFEQELMQKIQPDLRRVTTLNETIQSRIKALRSAQGSTAGDVASLADKVVALEEQLLPVPVIPRLQAGDITPERLAGVMAENGGCISIVDDEGGIFETLAGRYSKGVINIDTALKSHSGSPIRIDRMGRPTVVITRPCLSFVLTVQPAVLGSLFQKSGFRERGLIGRFSYVIPESRIGYRTGAGKPMSEQTMAAYLETVTRLLEQVYSPLNVATRDSQIESITAKKVLKFTQEAQAVFHEFFNKIERELRSDGKLANLTDWGGKLCGTVARISGLLQLVFDIERGEESIDVTADSVLRAIVIGNFLIEHAIAVFSLLRESSESKLQRRLLKWLEDRDTASFTMRELKRSFCRGDVVKDSELEDAVVELIKAGVCRPKQAEQQTGRPSEIYEVRPGMFTGPAKR